MPKTIEECRAAHGQVFTGNVEGVGEFVFRKPSPREWMEYDAARVPFMAAINQGTVTKAISMEFLQSCEELCTRTVVSHTAGELQELEAQFLSVFRDLSSEIASTTDALRAVAGKGASPPGSGQSAAKNPNA